MTDFIWLNDFSRQFLSRGYLIEGQTAEERLEIICNTAEKILKIPGFAKRFMENLKKGWYSLSTPIWCNFGTNRGLPISCFGSAILDSMDSIAYTWAEVCMMTKLGGGTSGYFGNLRGRGTPITNNGVSSGSVHFMKLFEQLIDTVSQGSSRRGNFAAYLDIDHKDIEEFLSIRSDGHPIQQLSFGVCIPDDWMKSMLAGDKAKRKVWAQLIECRINTGYPYILFTDTVNNNTVDVYKDKGMKIIASNLCMTGDQRVVTDRGLLTAKELYEQGEDLILFDNNKTVSASPMKLIEKNADVYKVTLENGLTHKITKYHKLVCFNGQTTEVKECQHLNIGDKIAIQTNKGLFGDLNMEKEAFLLGLYQSDGTQTDKEIMIDIWENDFDLLDEIQDCFDSIHNKYGCNTYTTKNQYGHTSTRTRTPAKFQECSTGQSNVRKKRLSSRTLKKALNFEKGYIPYWIWESDEHTQWQYVRGLLNGDGTVHMSNSNGNPIQIAYSSINRQFLEELQILLHNLGLQTSIRLLHDNKTSLLPNGKGGYSEYQTKTCWRLIIGNKNDALEINKNTGFLSRKGITLEDRSYRDNTKKFYAIKSIEYVGKEDVYCCTVNSPEHLFIANGFITHNCSEICLPSDENNSFVCDLSSMNIYHYDEWKDTDAVELLVYFLDAVMTEFIEKASKIAFMKRAVKFASEHRAIGIGWLGWHSYLQKHMIAWESMQAKYINMEVAENIYNKAYAASEKLAKEYGEPEVLKGYGRRNTTLLAIAPTKSSAFILGQVSEGIEPHRANYYIKDLQKGKYTIKNHELEKLLESKNKNTKEVWKSILDNFGSVQHLEFLSEEEKNVFKTFNEISPKEIIIQAAQRQKYIDQSQSLNLMFHPSTPAKDISKLLIEAWELKIKSLYYQFSINAAQNFTKNILNCTSCE